MIRRKGFSEGEAMETPGPGTLQTQLESIRTQRAIMRNKMMQQKLDADKKRNLLKYQVQQQKMDQEKDDNVSDTQMKLKVNNETAAKRNLFLSKRPTKPSPIIPMK